MASAYNRTAKRDDKFFEHLALGYGVTTSANAAGYGRRTVYDYRKSDDEFAARWEDAVAEYVESLECEVDRRAVEGVAKPVFYQGKKCGEINEFSDTLLMFRLKKLDPSYRDKQESPLDGGSEPTPVKIEVNVVDASKPDT